MKTINLPWIEPEIAFAAFADEVGAIFFDSSRFASDVGRYSILCLRPKHVISFKDKAVFLDGKKQEIKDLFSFMQTISRSLFPQKSNGNESNHQNIFSCGWAGYIGYEIAGQIETLPDIERDFDYPDLTLGYYDCVCVFDHAEQNAVLYVQSTDKNIPSKAMNIIEQINQQKDKSNQPSEIFRPPDNIEWTSNLSHQSYERAVKTVLDYINQGDIYQANISQKYTAFFDHKIWHPYKHYQYLRQISPASFATYQNWENLIISSNSPERFIRLHDRTIETKPIKGTMPRGKDSKQDKAHAKTLTESEKNRAENLMIVDLLRNDLGRVCQSSSIKVPELFKLETYPNVHHLVSTVTGTLDKNKTMFDLLQACFPGGSITGAPKIRAMEIISEIEKSARGIYCGCAVMIGKMPDGRNYLDSNILIRTLCYSDNQVSFRVGGGIVADSTPDDEYQETLHKAANIFRSFKKTQDRP